MLPSQNEKRLSNNKKPVPNKFIANYTCYSLACYDLPMHEFGDKIILPSQAFEEIQKLSTPLPLLFKLFTEEKETCLPSQYCGVLQFSAQESTMYIPYWMMQNLMVEEGSKVFISSALGVLSGEYCRLQPHSLEFLDLVVQCGSNEIMESAMKKYSALSVGETIIIEYGASKYFLDVIEVRPSEVISLFGNVDLEIDFMTPKNQDPRRPKTQEKSKVSSSNSSNHLIDKKKPQDNQDLSSSFVNTRQNFRCAPFKTRNFEFQRQELWEGAFVLNKAQQAFKSIGHIVGNRCSTIVSNSSLKVQMQPNATIISSSNNAKNQPRIHVMTSCILPTNSTTNRVGEYTTCTLCLADIPQLNVELHALRCMKTSSIYQRFLCSICNAKVLKTQENNHLHCFECQELFSTKDNLKLHLQQMHIKKKCECGNDFPISEFQLHKNTVCVSQYLVCNYCSLQFKRGDMVGHQQYCASRTEKCDICKKQIPILEWDMHVNRACIPAKKTPTPEIDDEEEKKIICVYCQKKFHTVCALEGHGRNCSIAKKFQDISSLKSLQFFKVLDSMQSHVNNPSYDGILSNHVAKPSSWQCEHYSSTVATRCTKCPRKRNLKTCFPSTIACTLPSPLSSPLSSTLASTFASTLASTFASTLPSPVASPVASPLASLSSSDFDTTRDKNYISSTKQRKNVSTFKSISKSIPTPIPTPIHHSICIEKYPKNPKNPKKEQPIKNKKDTYLDLKSIHSMTKDMTTNGDFQLSKMKTTLKTRKEMKEYSFGSALNAIRNQDR